MSGIYIYDKFEYSLYQIESFGKYFKTETLSKRLGELTINIREVIKEERDFNLKTINELKALLKQNENKLIEEKAKNHILTSEIEEKRYKELADIGNSINEIKNILSKSNQTHSISKHLNEVKVLENNRNGNKNEIIINNNQNDNQNKSLINKFCNYLTGGESQEKVNYIQHSYRVLNLIYFSEDFEYFDSINKQFNILSEKEKLYIKLERGIDMGDPKLNSSSLNNLNAIYVIFSSGSRSDYDKYKAHIELLQMMNYKVSLIIIKVGKYTQPTFFKEFQGTQINLKAFKSELYDMADNTQSLKTLIKSYIY